MKVRQQVGKFSNRNGRSDGGMKETEISMKGYIAVGYLKSAEIKTAEQCKNEHLQKCIYRYAVYVNMIYYRRNIFF